MTIPQLDGLQIEVLGEGNGTRETKRGDSVDVHYKGTLTNGKKFDASYDRGDPLNFTAGQGQVIKGWDEGLLGMKIGEKRKLTIAPHLAYGNRAVGGVIPANSTLVFETELMKINGSTDPNQA
ncbi:peptidyl-prolyl cis-trans isomerase fkr-2 [Apodospora peruviana]|uniref:peptidylprolyl isomerase n=1 Tax=Apodospora peruviana TaxID=516989 RepID=A0AAE0MB99_9PEZI|nr:peptidyl-prolyl cis-trans isomerase fkr-2 [Apodospora peruviana]